jgi:hypothetical protein
MDFSTIFPVFAAALVGFSGLGLVRLLRTDGLHPVPPPPGHAAWHAGELPSVPYAADAPGPGA